MLYEQSPLGGQQGPLKDSLEKTLHSVLSGAECPHWSLSSAPKTELRKRKEHGVSASLKSPSCSWPMQVTP